MVSQLRAFLAILAGCALIAASIGGCAYLLIHQFQQVSL
jgi:hypothetical protein